MVCLSGRSHHVHDDCDLDFDYDWFCRLGGLQVGFGPVSLIGFVVQLVKQGCAPAEGRAVILPAFLNTVADDATRPISRSGLTESVVMLSSFSAV